MRPLTAIEAGRFAMLLDYYKRNGFDPPLKEQRKMFRVSNGVVQMLRQTLYKKGYLRKVGRHYIPISPEPVSIPLASPDITRKMFRMVMHKLREEQKAKAR